MRLVNVHQIPIRLLQLRLHIVVPRELIKPGDREGILLKPVTGAGRLEFVIGEDVEGEAETAVEFILSLLNQTARSNDQATLHIVANRQFFDQETRHNRLAGPGIISEQKAQRLAREHFAVHCGDLMGEWLNKGAMDGQERIEEIRKTDAIRFRSQAEARPIAVKTPGTARRSNLNGSLPVAI